MSDPSTIQKAVPMPGETIYLRRNPETQAALNGATEILKSSQFVRTNSKTGGYVTTDIVRLSLKALARFIPYLDEHHPGWRKMSAGKADPVEKQVHFATTEEIDRLLRLIKVQVVGAENVNFVTNTDMVRLALTVVALFGKELDEQFPGWQGEDVI